MQELKDLDQFWLQVEALAGLGITIACHKADPAAAAPVGQRLQELAADSGDSMAIGFALATSAMVKLFRGDLEGSRLLNQQVLEACRMAGERWYEGETLRGLALASMLQHEYQQAEDELLAALDISWETGALPSMAVDLDRLAWVAIETGRPERAVVLGGAASALRESAETRLVAAPGDFGPEGFRWESEDPRQKVRGALTEDEIDVACAQGRSLASEQALAYAKAH